MCLGILATVAAAVILWWKLDLKKGKEEESIILITTALTAISFLITYFLKKMDSSKNEIKIEVQDLKKMEKPGTQAFEGLLFDNQVDFILIDESQGRIKRIEFNENTTDKLEIEKKSKLVSIFNESISCNLNLKIYKSLSFRKWWIRRKGITLNLKMQERKHIIFFTTDIKIKYYSEKKYCWGEKYDV